jgi:putative selenate reductase
VNPATSETSLPGLFAGGDAVHGPDSIIQAIADGRFAAEEIGRRHGIEPQPEPLLEKRVPAVDLMEKKAFQVRPQTVPTLPIHQRSGFAEVEQSFDQDAAIAEAARCLDCDDLCSLCVTVCPNRANMAYAMAPLRLSMPVVTFSGGMFVTESTRQIAIDQEVQIINIADFCNECGNCTPFCPTSGEPYKDKPRFWIDREGFDEAKGDAFRFERRDGSVLIEARLRGQTHRLECRDGIASYHFGGLVARLEVGSWRVLDCEKAGAVSEGETIDLSPCATLIALLESESVLPPTGSQTRRPE